MNRVNKIVICCAWILVAAIQMQPQSNTNASFQPISIQYLLRASDASGRSVPLAENEIKVLEDGRNIDNFHLLPLANQTISYLLLVDLSKSTIDLRNAYREIGDALLDKFQGSPGVIAAFGCNETIPASTATRQAFDTLMQHGCTSATTRLYDGVIQGAKQLARVSPKSLRVIFLLSDGWDNDSSNSLAMTMPQVFISGTPIFAVGVFREAKDRQRSGNNLMELAEAAGGYAFLLGSKRPSAATIAQSVADALLSSYDVTYFVTPNQKPTQHKINITATREKIRLQYPRSSFH